MCVLFSCALQWSFILLIATAYERPNSRSPKFPGPQISRSPKLRSRSLAP
jgi:hypothetical protein